MGAKTKTVLKGFDYMHCDDFAKYLSDMAAKGWHFKEWSIGLKFEKGEPEHVTYAVEVFTKASDDDMRPEPHTQEFAEYCEAAGWKLIDARQKFCIFKKVDVDALELFTPEERVINAFKGTVSGTAIVLLVLCGINALLQWTSILTLFESYIFSNSWLFSFSIWNLMFVAHACNVIYAFIKKRKMLSDIKKGKETYIGTQKDGRFHLTIKDIYSIVLILLLTIYLLMLGRVELVLFNLFVITATIILGVIIAKIRPESNMNVGIQFVYTFVLIFVSVIIAISMFQDEKDMQLLRDELPLQISDYREFTEEIEDISIYGDSNLLGSKGSYFIFSEDSVYYDVYRTKHTWILDRLWEDGLSPRYNKVDGTDCTSEWGAQQAFRNKTGTYYVRFEQTILIINENEDVYLTEEQIDIICDKLDLR